MKRLTANSHRAGHWRAQRGAATLFVTLVILVILTIIVLASSNLALFEQKTATNENRGRLAEQAAEHVLAQAGEYLKANVVNIASNEDDDGWLTSGGSNQHWQSCAGITNTAHPCFAEPVATTRSQLYYYTATGDAVTDPTSADLNGPYDELIAVNPDIGNFGVTTRVRALLCRLDTTAGSTPSCQENPTTGNRIAITLIAEATVDGENAASQVKETWGTYSNFSATSAVPLVAAGLVEGLGNAQIVAAPNAGGYGLAGSIWSPQDVDVDDSGSGVGSVQTCHLGDYLGNVPVSELMTTCAGTGNTGCGCDVDNDSSDYLSGHVGSVKEEGIDILDIDGQPDDQPLPDIQFFPGKKADGTCLDDASVEDDDNLFEWIFSEDVNGASTCATDADPDKVVEVLTDLGAETIDDCSSLDSESSGLYYVTGNCDFGDDVGSADNQVVVVVNDALKVNGNTNFFGMIFVRDSSGAGDSAEITGNGNFRVFGSVVVEGDVNITGGIEIIYVDTSAGTPGGQLPASTRFARLPGSWLDSSSGF
jgi:type II secretory pathway pseudopilin PulG